MASTAAPKTPSQRIVELTSEISYLENRVADESAKTKILARQLSRYHSFKEASFGGIPMAQYWCDLMLWEAVLNSNPEMTGVIEIGTWQGGFSTWLWANCMARKLRFVTFDAVEPERQIPNFQRLDVFANPLAVQGWIETFKEPLLLFCDGGNKPRELRGFSAMLKDERSLVAVHDWGTETKSKDVPSNLREEYGSYCDELGSITRFFRVAT